MDPIARMALRLAMMFRNPPGRRQLIVMLVALGLALGIGVIDRAFDLFPKADGSGQGRIFRWH
jgi:hypothetical protein